jgi:hypothetical protein
MLKNRFLALAAASIMVIFSASAMAQGDQLTASDIDFFVKIVAAPAADQPKLLEESQLTPQRYSDIMSKISLYASTLSQPLDDATKKAILESNPSVKFTGEEIALLDSRKSDLQAAFSAMIAPK